MEGRVRTRVIPCCPSLIGMRKASETVALLWGCPGPSMHAGARSLSCPHAIRGQAQGTGPGWCTNNIPATHPPRVLSVRVRPSASTLPQVCKSDPTLSSVLGAQGSLVRCPHGSSEACPPACPHQPPGSPSPFKYTPGLTTCWVLAHHTSFPYLGCQPLQPT